MRAIVAGLAGVTGLAAATDALAFCRTAGCDTGVGAQCTPTQASDCGKVLSWPSPCISYSLQEDGTSLAPFETVQTLMRAAFDTWQQATCSGATPGFLVEETDTVACAKRDFDQNGGTNANLIVFRDDDWPYSAKGVLALTTVTYGLDTGTIRDADMEINSQEVDFSFGDQDVTYDFQSVVTHEAGHFLGLAHSPVEDATMRRDYDKGSIELRTLSDDDVAAICAVYPPAEIAECAPEPEGGLRGTCDDAGSGGDEADGGGETDAGCAVSATRGRAGSAVWAALALLGAAAVTRRGVARRNARA